MSNYDDFNIDSGSSARENDGEGSPADSIDNNVDNKIVSVQSPAYQTEKGEACAAEGAEVIGPNAETGAGSTCAVVAANGAEEAAAAEQADKETAGGSEGESVYVPPKKTFRKKCYFFFKRVFDIFSSALFLIIFSWLYLILAVAVKCSDGGPVFYKHERVGKNGKTIYIPKFRSMKKNADRLEDMLTPEQLEKYKTEYKIDNDPRITKLGAFLRKTSLDELPNIWAVFVGSISLIGPRPIMRSEAEEKYGKDMAKLLSVKPGMIGWWAANGRNNSTYGTGERQKLELYYVDHCSALLDIKIIFKTIGGVLKRTGAK